MLQTINQFNNQISHNSQIMNMQPMNILTPRQVINKIDDCINHLDIGPNSKRTYRRALNHFINWIEDKLENNTLEYLQESDIMEYKECLRDSDFSAYTSNNYLNAVKRFFKWMNQTGQYPNISINVKGFKKSKGFKKDTLNETQIADTLKGIDRTTLKGKRDFAILAMLITTGARTIEVVRANIEDMRSVEGEYVLYVQGKGRDDKDEFILLIPEVKAAIDEYLKARGNLKEKEALFASAAHRNYGERMTTRSVSRLVKTYFKEAGIDDRRLTAHSLRHTAITNALADGATVQEAQQMARHSNINTTMIYAQNLNRIKSAPEKRLAKYII